MLKETNLEMVKSIANALVKSKIRLNKFSPIIVDHPIFESAFNNVDGTCIVNILEDESSKQKLINRVCKKINSYDSVYNIYSLFRSAYKLTFIKCTINYLSIEDMSKLLADAWIMEENPNQDVNVSVSLAAKWFKMADKRILMDEDDYAIYESLDDVITVYRGVAVGRNPKGLSWTNDYDKAYWFAHRFDNKDKSGYVQKGIVNKKDVLAYFNTRGEEELVVSIFKIKDLCVIE